MTSDKKNIVPPKPRPASKPRPKPPGEGDTFQITLTLTTQRPKRGGRGPAAKFELLTDRAFWERIVMPSRDTIGYNDPEVVLVSFSDPEKV